MGMQSWKAALISTLVGLLVAGLVVQLAARHPFITDPQVIPRFLPQHNYRAPGLMELWITWGSILVLFLSTATYFWLAALPRVIRYRPRRKGR
jgi:hypothetical protein